VERVEDEGGLARAAQAGDDDVFAERQIEIEALEVVLAHAAQADALGLGVVGDGGRPLAWASIRKLDNASLDEAWTARSAAA
jgi:hypothetical protein